MPEVFLNLLMVRKPKPLYRQFERKTAGGSPWPIYYVYDIGTGNMWCHDYLNRMERFGSDCTVEELLDYSNGQWKEVPYVP